MVIPNGVGEGRDSSLGRSVCQPDFRRCKCLSYVTDRMLRGVRLRSMAKKQKKTPPVVAHPDAVRIVPLHGHAPYQAVTPVAPAKLTYRNGPLLNTVEVFTIFWGKGWKATPQSEMIAKVNGFFDFIL